MCGARGHLPLREAGVSDATLREEGSFSECGDRTSGQVLALKRRPHAARDCGGTGSARRLLGAHISSVAPKSKKISQVQHREPAGLALHRRLPYRSGDPVLPGLPAHAGRDSRLAHAVGTRETCAARPAPCAPALEGIAVHAGNRRVNALGPLGSRSMHGDTSLQGEGEGTPPPKFGRTPDYRQAESGLSRSRSAWHDPS